MFFAIAVFVSLIVMRWRYEGIIASLKERLLTEQRSAEHRLSIKQDQMELLEMQKEHLKGNSIKQMDIFLGSNEQHYPDSHNVRM